VPLKHVRWVSRALLVAAGLALIAATPAALAAASVSNPWVLAGATAVAALVVMSGGIAQDRYRRQQTHRQDQIGRGEDGCLVCSDGTLPAVSTVSDPTRLGVQQAAHAEAESGTPAGSARLPAYIPRHVDGEMREQLAAGGFVLLVGESAAGKTRTAYEAMRATLPDHTLIAPASLNAVRAAITHAAHEMHCVLWLDDLERFLGPGGLGAADVQQVVAGSGHHRVIIATIRDAEEARLSIGLRDDERTSQVLGDVRELLDQAIYIRLTRSFTTSERLRAAARAWDPQIAGAIQDAVSHRIAEYLTAGPVLLREWKDARGSLTGAHRRGAAIVSAATDIRRAGFLSPIPRDLLDEIHARYLDVPKRTRVQPEPLADAWEWATRQRSGGSGFLAPADGNRVEVFGYLTDAVQRRAGRLNCVPEPIVRTALASSGAADASSLARTAYSQGRWQLAADAWRVAQRLLTKDPAIGPDHPDTLTIQCKLALTLHDLGQLDEAENEARLVLETRQRVLGPDHPDTLTSRSNLAAALRDQGRLDEAENEVRSVLETRQRVLGPDHPDTLTSRSNLAAALRDQGRLDEAEREVRSVLETRHRVLGPDHAGTLASRGDLALVLRRMGMLSDAEAEHRAVLAVMLPVLGADHPSTLGSRNNLAGVLRDQGRLDEAEHEIRAVLAGRQLTLGADHPDTLASRGNLARVLRDRGWLDEAEAEARAILAIRLRVLGPDHASTKASRNDLAEVLEDQGRHDQAAAENGAVREAGDPEPASNVPVIGPDGLPTESEQAGAEMVAD
jgi:tetratricopeptide (TPR) repeat protein